MSLLVILILAYFSHYFLSAVQRIWMVFNQILALYK